MDRDVYSRRTDRLMFILANDGRLSDGMPDTVQVKKGLPFNRLQERQPPTVFVHWTRTPRLKIQPWSGTSKEDHWPQWNVWFLVSDYTDEETAETLFETLAANVLRVLTDEDNVALADHWTLMEPVSGGSEIAGLGSQANWRLGQWTIHMAFSEEIN